MLFRSEAARLDGGAGDEEDNATARPSPKKQERASRDQETAREEQRAREDEQRAREEERKNRRSQEPGVEVHDPEHMTEPPDVPTPPNGRRSNQPRKMETQVLPGGVIMRKFANGSQIISMPDGTRIFVSAEGTRTVIPPPKNRQNRRQPPPAPSP